MMKSSMKSNLVVLALVLSTCTAAHALHFNTPEIDPNMAVSGLTLLAGTIAALSVRRRK
jgi:hypothetical protein